MYELIFFETAESKKTSPVAPSGRWTRWLGQWGRVICQCACVSWVEHGVVCNRKTRVAMRQEELDSLSERRNQRRRRLNGPFRTPAGAAAAHATGTLVGGGVCLLVAWIAASGVRDHGLRA